MILRLLQLTPPSEDGLLDVVFTLERRRAPSDPDAALARRTIIEWLRANGHAVVPRDP